MSQSIESPSRFEHSLWSSKRRAYSGSSSRRFLDPDVIEIPNPSNSTKKKEKEVVFLDVIDIDNDDDSTDLVVLGEKVGKNNKGKEIESIHGGYGDHKTRLFSQTVPFKKTIGGAQCRKRKTIADEVRVEIPKKFLNFKQFDTIDDASDHFFVRSNSSIKQHSKNWGKKIQEEWKLLEKHLPESIFVRVYESRIDLLRAVIIGAEGTPYHDGLFLFDVFFPSDYPNVPPQVHYHSGGVRLNPNLYACGKVCLSLLNTWSGSEKERWLPGVSTMLQVLVSIQGLILNTKPYFNEPGWASLRGSADGERRSLKYNEDTFLLSLKTMVYLIRSPPKHFKDLVIQHFCSQAHDILVAIKAYMDGAQVGCLVKGGVQDLDQGDKSCSKEFKSSLPAHVDMLVKEFTKIGVKDCEKFLSSSTRRDKPSY